MTEQKTDKKPSQKKSKNLWLWLLLILAIIAGYFIGSALANQLTKPEEAEAQTILAMQERLAAEQALRVELELKLAEYAQLGNLDTEALANYRKQSEARIEALQAEVLTDRTAIAELAAENTSLKETLLAANIAIAELRESLTKTQTMQTDFDAAVLALAAAKADAQRLSGEIAQTQQALLARDARIVEQDNSLAQKKAELAQKTALIKALETDLAAMTIELADVSAQLGIAQEEIVRLIDGRGGVYDKVGRPSKFRRNF